MNTKSLLALSSEDLSAFIVQFSEDTDAQAIQTTIEALHKLRQEIKDLRNQKSICARKFKQANGDEQPSRR